MQFENFADQLGTRCKIWKYFYDPCTGPQNSFSIQRKKELHFCGKKQVFAFAGQK